MRFLVDTNIISELRKGSNADANVASWFSNLETEQIFLSVLTLGEIRKGIESIRRRDPTAAQSLSTWASDLARIHSGRILTVDLEVADAWAKVNVPDPLPVVDSLLAATAIVHGLTLATRNVKDVERSGVATLNPFASPGSPHF